MLIDALTVQKFCPFCLVYRVNCPKIKRKKNWSAVGPSVKRSTKAMKFTFEIDLNTVHTAHAYEFSQLILFIKTSSCTSGQPYAYIHHWLFNWIKYTLTFLWEIFIVTFISLIKRIYLSCLLPSRAKHLRPFVEVERERERECIIHFINGHCVKSI